MEGNNRVFADSNFFVALFNPFDSLYGRADQIAGKLAAKDFRLVISNFIFLEVVTVLAQKRGKEKALEMGGYLLTNPTIEHVHIDEWLQEKSWEVFQETANRNMSFVDCSIIAAMRAEGISKLLTFDTKDFKGLRSRHRFGFFEA